MLSLTCTFQLVYFSINWSQSIAQVWVGRAGIFSKTCGMIMIEWLNILLSMSSMCEYKLSVVFQGGQQSGGRVRICHLFHCLVVDIPTIFHLSWCQGSHLTCVICWPTLGFCLPNLISIFDVMSTIVSILFY